MVVKKGKWNGYYYYTVKISSGQIFAITSFVIEHGVSSVRDSIVSWQSSCSLRFVKHNRKPQDFPIIIPLFGCKAEVIGILIRAQTSTVEIIIYFWLCEIELKDLCELWERNLQNPAWIFYLPTGCSCLCGIPQTKATRSPRTNTNFIFFHGFKATVTLYMTLYQESVRRPFRNWFEIRIFKLIYIFCICWV